MSRTAPVTLTVQVPFTIRKRGGRKEIVLPEGTSVPRLRVDSTLVKALARAFRWKRMIDSGAFATIGDLAAHEKIASSYLNRVMRLTLLAPEIVEGIVEGRCAEGLAEMLGAIPVAWERHANSEGFFPRPQGARGRKWNQIRTGAFILSQKKIIMTKQHLDKQDAGKKFNVLAEAQKQKMDQATTKHAGKIKGDTEPNAGGENREVGDRKARTNDRATNGGE